LVPNLRAIPCPKHIPDRVFQSGLTLKNQYLQKWLPLPFKPFFNYNFR
jgi:hypothetical protein